MPLEIASMNMLAYIGPGAGLGLAAALFGLLASIAVALFAVVIYPIRAMLKRKDADGGSTESADSIGVPATQTRAHANP